jgi:sortase A
MTSTIRRTSPPLASPSPAASPSPDGSDDRVPPHGGAVRDGAGVGADAARRRPADLAAPGSVRPGIWVVAAAWLAVTAVGIGLVLLQVGPLVNQRDQRSLMREFRTDLVAAANASYGLPGTSAPIPVPEAGSPVAILDSADLALRQVVVEGVGPQQTRRGPGHVPGTAGPGQPGNSVIVGRSSLAGGTFGSIGDLAVGDEILVTTTQGQSVYVVGHVGTHRIVDQGPEEAPDPYAEEVADGDPTAGDGPLLPAGALTVDQVQGPSADDRLTLMTSASTNPFGSEQARVVVAALDGTPFAPTPQGGRTAAADGRHADAGASASVVLALLAYAAAVAAAVLAYRRVPWRGAYLLTAPPLVATTIVLAEQLTRLLPAWA